MKPFTRLISAVALAGALIPCTAEANITLTRASASCSATQCSINVAYLCATFVCSAGRE